jgi:serine/threonine-protein kinase
MTDNEDSLPRLLDGRYRLEARLGHGGMGVVYRATDLMMQRPVAVKVIRGPEGAELDEEVAGRFLREAKNTARVQHEHIIEVFDLGRSREADLFLVMELLEGESISTRLRRIGRYTAADTVHIAKQICTALHVAHSAGIVHRDLKPANVMLIRRAGDNAYVKVLDFGVAKSYSPDQQTALTHTGMLVGTVEYMAPEQIMGRPVDARTDIYSLGVVLYRMLAGQAPFKDGGVPALIHQHLNVAPKPIRDAAPDVPSTVERAVLRALAKQPDERFASMLELAQALGAGVAADAALPSLEYAPNDGAAPDESSDTAATRIARTGAQPSGFHAPASFDDATVKMERSRVPRLRGDAPTPAAPPVVLGRPIDIDETAVMVSRADESTAKRAVPEEIARRERAAVRTCAMCQTVNAPHARACSACGVSLAQQDQEAVRARVGAPRAAHAHALPAPPAVSGAYVFGAPATPAPMPPPPYLQTPSQGVHQAAWAAQQARPARPPSAWDRFLAWAGLRGR